MPRSEKGPRGRAVRVAVRGRVQGVGYRDGVRREAGDLGVMGWVRNREDGTVAVHAEGAEAVLERLLSYLERGPGAARVEAVEVKPAKVEGHEQFAIRGVSAGRFQVREGDGGYELWLEVDGTHRRWRLAKQPVMDPAVKRLAIAQQASDAGAGAAGRKTWDSGPYEQGGRVPWPEALRRGHAVFVLHGERLRGGFALQRTGAEREAGGERWLLIKRRDEQALTGTDGSN